MYIYIKVVLQQVLSVFARKSTFPYKETNDWYFLSRR